MAAVTDRAVPSTTAATLRMLRVALTAGCVLSGVLCLLVFTAAHRTVDQGVRQSAQAVLQADAVKGALVDADQVAAAGIQSKTALLGGTAGKYDNDIAAVHQGLELIAEHNAAGDQGAQQLELVVGVVVSYTAEIQQANADLQRGDENLSLVYLRNASYLLHQDQGILYDLGKLRDKEQKALDRQRSSPWVAWYMTLLWLVPLLALLALLLHTHTLIRRRFRRLLSVRLLVAGAALVVMGITTGLSLVSNARFAAAINEPFSQVTTQEGQQAHNADVDGHGAFTGLIADRCKASGSCATEVTGPDFLPKPIPAPTSGPPAAGDVTAETARFTTMADAAEAGSTVRTVLITAMAAAASVLIAFGIRPRINEYRFGRS